MAGQATPCLLPLPPALHGASVSSVANIGSVILCDVAPTPAYPAHRSGAIEKAALAVLRSKA